MRKLKLIVLAGALLVAASADGLAQNEGSVVRPRSARLPPAFNMFSAADVLRQVFDSYDPATGRVAAVPNGERKPTLVRINEAKLWRAGGAEQLVVLVELGGDDYQLGEGSLCGNCGAYVVLAVLRREGDRLSLVAMQTPPSSSAPEQGADADDPSQNPYAPLFYTGHGSLALDLAPYKLNARETLIGVRSEEMWIPALTYSTTLQLYRIEGRRLREVFSEPVIDREYPEQNSRERQTVTKTVSTLTPLPSGGEFYDLSISKTVFRCSDRDEDWDCGGRGEAVRQTGSRRELWRFDGERFRQVVKPGGGTRPNVEKRASRARRWS